MEAVLGFAVGVITAWWFLGILFCALLLSEYHESGWTYLFFALAVAALFLNTDITFKWWWVPTYPLIGFIWSFWRYRQMVAYRLETLDKPTENFDRNAQIKAVQEDTAVRVVLDRIVYWVLFWPTNFLIHFTRDLWRIAAEFIRDRLGEFYEGLRDGEIEKFKARNGE